MKRAFTLIELLIVVAIIAILAAIVVPNFLEAQTRAKVSRAKSDMRTAAGVLEAYAVDNTNHYPPDSPRTGLDGFLFCQQLTTPVAYLTSLATVIDPFRRDLDLVPADADEAYRYFNLMGRGSAAPPDGSATCSSATDGPWIVSSAGPNRRDDYPAAGPDRYVPETYDATNGTVSRGDIWRSERTGQR
jgi:prepilin-type N-terminal cleavage/methylation domain-containing protein